MKSSRVRYLAATPRFVLLKFFPLLIFFLSCYVWSHAQEPATRITVNGLVTDSSGAPMPSATITEKGTTNATTSGADGRFSISVANERSTLVFTSVGYEASEVRVGNKRDISIQLSLQSGGLGEVVVIGYGTRRRGSITGAVSSITSKDIDRVHAGSTVSAALAGKLPVAL